MPVINKSFVDKENSMPSVTPYSDRLNPSPVVPLFRSRSRDKHRRTRTQDWLNYLDFVHKRTRNLTPKER